jgi:type I thyroxine 5'-deiodinase
MFVVYIEEAHASNGWQLPVNEKQGVVFAKPATDAEREQVAEACVRKLNIEIPALVDRVDNATERAYTGWPDRLYVIDKDGKVVFKSAPGPFGFDAKAMGAALKSL